MPLRGGPKLPFRLRSGLLGSSPVQHLRPRLACLASHIVLRSCPVPYWDLALRLSLSPCRPGWSNLLPRCRTACRHVRAPGFPPCPRYRVPAHALGHWCRVRGGPLTCPNAGHGLPDDAATTPWLKLLDPSNNFVDRMYLPSPPPCYITLHTG